MDCTITKFVERDIDLLLAEELAVNAAFTQWLLGRVGKAGLVRHPAERVNVSDHADGSEADVLADFRRHDGSLHRVLIEDKIDATLMPEQLQRYLRRGEGDIRMGVCASFSAFLCAPRAYAAPELPGVHRLDFEDLADGLRETAGGPRGVWRASLVLAARPFGGSTARSAQVLAHDPFIAMWWDSVYLTLEGRHPGYFVHRTRYPRSTYFAPARLQQPLYLRVDFKGHKGEVDLAFKNLSVERLEAACRRIGSVPGALVANKRSASLRIGGLDPVVISDGFAAIEPRMMPLYDAARVLLDYWYVNREIFEDAYGENADA